MKLAAALLLTACWRGAPTEMPVQQPHATDAQPAAAVRAFPPRSTWTGWYVCAQGKTAVRLTIELLDRGSRALAIFEFGPLDENPGVSSGRYAMRGTAIVTPDGGLAVDFMAGHWLDQPSGYLMVGFAAASGADRRLLRGTIDHPSCGALEVHRIS